MRAWIRGSLTSGSARGSGDPHDVRAMNRAGWVGMLGLALLVGMAVLAPVLRPGDPLDLVARPLIGPFVDPRFPLGTDQLGRDVWAQLLYGARVSLVVGLAAAVGAIGIGIVVGTLAGFLGGRVDGTLMRITEAFQTVPTFLLALALVAAFGASTGNVVLAIAISAWPATARLVRAEVLSLRQREYVDAARLAGLGPVSIAFREVLPGALQPVVALVGVTVGSAILVESALAFLGLGDANQISWGTMISNGRAAIRVAPSLVIIPGICVALAILSVSLVGDSVAARLAPQRRLAP